jgi:hypothetical protein
MTRAPVRLTPRVVGDILETTLGYRVTMDPHGFELRAANLVPRRARLRCGSGIAGRGAVWPLVLLPAGRPIALGLDTRAKLVRAVLEFMAGPPPPRLSKYTAPRVKRVVHPHTGAARFVWYRRLRKHPNPRVTPVPIGASPR